jgi:hypothetical protein
LFRALGEVDAASFCVAVACGLPRDAAAVKGRAALPSTGSAVAAGASTFGAAASHPALGAVPSSASFGALHLGGGSPLADAAGRVLRSKFACAPQGTQSAAPSGGASDSTAFRFSLGHDGLFKFLGRLLRPLWFSPIVCLFASPDPGDQTAAGAWKRPRLSTVPVKLKVRIHGFQGTCQG